MTQEQLNNISLGFDWNPDMDFDQFAKSNPRIKVEDRWKIYDEIELRYANAKFENENK